MKIIITVNSLTKGSGLSKYVYNLCNVLKGDDNELHIITTHAEQPEFEHQLFKRDKNIRVHQLHQFSKISRYVKLFFLIWRLKADANSTSKCKITKCLCKSTPLVLRNSISFLVSH